MLRIISTAVGVATKAGAEIRKIAYSDCKGVIDKGVQDFQTEADRRAQRLLVGSLSKRFPKCTIVGEEELAEDLAADAELTIDCYDDEVLKKALPIEYSSIKEEDITIWIDPLDATAEFVKGLSHHVTVLIGISVNDRAVAGIVHQPFFGVEPGQRPAADASNIGRTIWGLVGLGYFGPISRDNLPQDKLIVTTTASHGNKAINESIEALKPDQVIRVGGAGHKVLLVMEGKAHAYVFASNGSKRWDTCAPEAVLRSMGGELTDVFGKPIEYCSRSSYQNYLGIVASVDGAIHKKVIDSIPLEIKNDLLQVRNQNLTSKF